MQYLPFLSLVCLASFLFASGLFLLGFRQGRVANLSGRWGHIAFAFGTIILTVLAVATLEPVSGSGSDLHSTAIWLATALGWLSIIAWFVWNLNLIGAFTSPLIALVLLVDAFFTRVVLPAEVSTPSSPLLSVHVASAIIGQAFAIAACGASLMLLWQERKLRKRQLSDVPDSFPAMDILSKALSMTLWIGFSFITTGLLTGAVIVQIYNPPASFSVGAKASWAILVWSWYLCILVLRNILSYRPQKIARMSLIGFALLAISWFGMAFTHPWSGP